MNLKWSLEKRKMPLAFEWKISRGAITEKENIFIKLEDIDRHQVFFGECSPNKRYGESIDLIEEEWNEFAEAKEELENKSQFSSLKTAIQYCRLQHEASLKSQNITEYLGRERIKSLSSSFSIPIMEPHELQDFLNKYDTGFSFYKMKVAGLEGLELVHEYFKLKKEPLLIDGNEGFKTSDEVMEMIKALSDYPILYLEQPLASDNLSEQKKLFEISPLPIFADESCLNETKVSDLLGLFHGINIKLMKSKPLRAIEQLEEAKRLGLKTMIGCMVETTLGISMVMELGLDADYYDLDGWLFFKDEPFKKITNKSGVFYLR